MREVVVKLPYEVSIPEAGSVFDYYLDLKQYQYLSWDERPAKEDVLDGYVALPEVQRVSSAPFLLAFFLLCINHVLYRFRSWIVLPTSLISISHTTPM